MYITFISIRSYEAMGNLINRMFMCPVCYASTNKPVRFISMDFEMYLCDIQFEFREVLKHIIMLAPKQPNKLETVMLNDKKSTSLKESSIQNILPEFYKNVCKPNGSFSDCFPIFEYIRTFFRDDEPSVIRDNLTLYFLIKYGN